MKDDRLYSVLIESGNESMWAMGIEHDHFIDGIQNGGLLQHFGNKRHKILNFKVEANSKLLRRISELENEIVSTSDRLYARIGELESKLVTSYH